MESANVVQDLCKYRPLLDSITAHVPSCSGYELICYEAPYLGVEFKYPGGIMPLAIDPLQPIPHLVELVTRGIVVWRGIMALKVPTWGDEMEASPTLSAISY